MPMPAKRRSEKPFRTGATEATRVVPAEGRCSRLHKLKPVLPQPQRESMRLAQRASPRPGLGQAAGKAGGGVRRVPGRPPRGTPHPGWQPPPRISLIPPCDRSSQFPPPDPPYTARLHYATSESEIPNDHDDEETRGGGAGCFLLCTAGALRAAAISPGLDHAINDVFKRVDRLSPMPYGKVYTLTVGGKPMTAPPDDFLRRRTGREILESGMSDGGGDNAIAAVYLLEQQGYETRFIDSAEISTQSLAYGFSGAPMVAVRDRESGAWVRVDVARHEYSYPFSLSDKSFYGSYWIGFRGRLADYPAHDPRVAEEVLSGHAQTIPPEVLNQHLFRFQFTVDASLIGPDGKYRNPNLEGLLRDNGKVLAAHGVHPVNTIAITLVAGRQDAESHLEYSHGEGWVCTLGLESACGLGLVSYFEERLNGVLDRGEPLHAVGAPATPVAPATSATPAWLPWTASESCAPGFSGCSSGSAAGWPVARPRLRM